MYCHGDFAWLREAQNYHDWKYGIDFGYRVRILGCYSFPPSSFPLPPVFLPSFLPSFHPLSLPLDSSPLFRYPLAYVFGWVLDLKMVGIWISMTIAWIAATLIFLIFIFRLDWEHEAEMATTRIRESQQLQGKLLALQRQQEEEELASFASSQPQPPPSSDQCSRVRPWISPLPFVSPTKVSIQME
jgi:hypothetical protein